MTKFIPGDIVTPNNLYTNKMIAVIITREIKDYHWAIWIDRDCLNCYSESTEIRSKDFIIYSSIFSGEI